jgi:dUTP pyrophosphatase
MGKEKEISKHSDSFFSNTKETTFEEQWEYFKDIFSMKTLEVYKLDPEAKVPTRNLSTDAGLDLYALEDVFVLKNRTALVKTGIAVNIPSGYVGKVEDRSSMALKGLRVGGGIIDTGYSGDVSVILHNLNNDTEHNFYGYDGVQVRKGQKIAQLLLIKVETPEVKVVENLWESERGAKGYGSSGL